MNAQARIASNLFAIPAFCIFLLGTTLPAGAKEDWQADLHKWAESSQTDPNCKVRYTIGIYRPDMGDKPTWGLMTEKMFKWFSRDGAKLAPSVCPVSHATRDKAEYRILFSVSPMKTISQTTHGSEVHTTSEPFNASVTSRTTYSDGGFANGTATINGQQTSTVVVPTETTISRSSVALYMYTYRVNGNQLELIATDSVVFNRVAASGSGDNAAGAELGAGIGNLIRASGDRHRTDKLYEEAVKAIRAYVEDGVAKQDTLPESHASEGATIDAPGAAAALAQAPVPATPPVTPILAQASLNIDSTPTGADIEIDGAFVGDTPSTVSVAPGNHQIVVNKKGFTDWSRTLNVTSGSVHLNAELEQKPTFAVPPQPPAPISTSSESTLSAQSIATLKEKAASGDAEAQYELGEAYHFGKGVQQDDAQAVEWDRKAGLQGYVYAQFRLGTSYANGLGVPLDKAQAAAWFQKAAEQGNVYAQEMLGSDYLAGEGVPLNYAEAYFWLYIASAGNAPEPVAGLRATERDAAAVYLTRTELSRARERARKWLEDHPKKP
jgi:hypothetical protein